MRKSLTHLMLDSGWQRQERVNAGKCYVEWTRDGYVLDEGDINEIAEIIGKEKK